MVTVGLAQVTSLLLLPIITRYLAPAAYGEYTLVLATTALVGTLGSSWIRNVAMRLHFDFAREGRSAALFATAALMQAGILSILMVAGYVWTRWVSDPVSLSTYVAGAVAVLVSDAYALTTNTLRAEQRASAFGVAEITSSLLRLGGTWVGLLVGYRTPAMLFVFATVALLVAGAAIVPQLRGSLAGPRVLDREAARELARVGLPSVPLWVGSWFMTLSNRTFLAWYDDLSAVGIYSVAQGVGERAITGLALGLSMMAWPAILRVWIDRPRETPRLIGTFVLIYTAMTFGPAVGLAVHREAVIDLLVGPDYRDASAILPLIAAGTWLIGLAGFLNRALELRKSYGTLSGITIGAAAVNVILNLWLVPRHGIVGAAAGTAGAGIVMVIVAAVVAVRIEPLPIPWLAVSGVVAATAVATLVSWPLTAPIPAIGVFGVVYTPLAFVVSRHGIKEFSHHGA